MFLLTFFNLIPKIVYMLGAAVLAALLATTAWQLHSQKSKYEKLDKAFVEYRLLTESNAAKAQAEVRTLETRANDNERKTRDEQDKLQKANALDRANLERTIASLRKQQVRYAAGIAADAKTGNITSLATRATVAGELFQACSGRYTELGDEAETVRLQAIGLYQYIKGNPLASTPFDPAAP